ncbi:hypothetical protein [Chitinophaga barathri]|uniref:Uncharacterized protein n=1 Tax=Chitinophaga barathri TaxID=1647451 RepID=A0A3N4MDE8_9BACT|nr:hypothetical protein [Chitinophaga barathri]RPD41588.1 hypothetical protein EG028_09790 [Chitinophaga barathri]
MTSRFLALMSASVWCTTASAQQFLKRDTLPFPRYTFPLKDSLKKDTVPMRVYQLKEFNVRHRNFSEDSLQLAKLQKKGFKFIMPKLDGEKGIAYEKDGRTHHLPGVAVNVAAIASVFDFKKKARDEAFRRRLVSTMQEREVDKMYNAYLVGRFIPLQGDSLYEFIDKTRPNAAFLAGITAYDLGVYVKRRYKEYLDTIPGGAKTE